MLLAIASFLMVVATGVTGLVYTRWARRWPHWPPAPDEAAPPVGEGPYRSADVDVRLPRPSPRSARVATATALLYGQLAIAGAIAAIVTCLVAIPRLQEREDLLLAKAVALVAVVVAAAGVQLLRTGPLLMRCDERARPAVVRAASWATAMGCTLFALLFGVLGGAVGQHELWLCFTLLVGSLSALAASSVLRAAVAALPGQD